MTDKVTGFHIEPTNICTLKCAGCPRTQFIKQWPQHWRNHSLDIDAVLKFLDIDLTGKKIALCGNYGDPIYHPDFINFVAKLKQAGTELLITTNGSYRTETWWKELTQLLDHNDTVRFSIDGTPDNFLQYRKNADWHSIHTGIKICVASDCKTVWKYIPFSYNQDSIETAKKLSEQLGFDNFLVECSDRYDDSTAHLLPDSQDLIKSLYTNKKNWKEHNVVLPVDPRCKSGGTHYITADGHYTPCCDTADHRFYYKTQFGKNKKDYDITQHTFSQLLADTNTLKFYQTLDQQSVCQFSCPKKESVV